MEPETPFRAVSHEAPRLDARTRLNSLLSATALALLAAAVIVLVWAWWVERLRDREEIPPIEVSVDPG